MVCILQSIHQTHVLFKSRQMGNLLSKINFQTVQHVQQKDPRDSTNTPQRPDSYHHLQKGFKHKSMSILLFKPIPYQHQPQKNIQIFKNIFKKNSRGNKTYVNQGREFPNKTFIDTYYNLSTPSNILVIGQYQQARGTYAFAMTISRQVQFWKQGK